MILLSSIEICCVIPPDALSHWFGGILSWFFVRFRISSREGQCSVFRVPCPRVPALRRKSERQIKTRQLSRPAGGYFSTTTLQSRKRESSKIPGQRPANLLTSLRRSSLQQRCVVKRRLIGKDITDLRDESAERWFGCSMSSRSRQTHPTRRSCIKRDIHQHSNRSKQSYV